MPTTLHRTLGAALLTLSAGLGATSAHAAEVWLQAQSFGKPLPDGASVPMWGFAACGANFLSCGGPTAPGPVIDGVVGEGLTVHVKNTLAVPISLVIPGLAGAGNPPARVDGRYQSFTAVVAAGATRDYSWSTPRPGTFLYQSGTQPSIQVPMGLYGALVVRDGCPSSCVYGGRSYDAEALLLLSEIDPVQNQAVADAVAADASSPAYPGTVRYTPKYFLVNGEPFDKAVTGSNLIPAGAADDDTLLVRLLNAGLRSHVAAVVGLDLEVIAEDANLYPTSRKHSATLLPAGKTHDAFAALAGDRTYAFYDRMLDLTNSDAPEGGMLAYLVVGAGSSLPPGASEFVARDDAYTVLEDSSGNVLHVLLNDDSTVNTPSLVTPPTNGTAVANAGGTFTYTPNADYFGNDAFTYIPINGTNVATVRITVTGVNDVPVAGPDSYSNNVGMTITVAKPGLLGNDQDRDGDTLTASASVPGLSLSADGSFTYAGGSGTFPYQVSDGTVTGTTTGSVTFTMGVPAGVALNVVGPNDEAVTEYRWIVEEDVMWHPDPTVAPPSSSDPDATLATSFHKSYLPVVAQGCVGGRCESPIPFGQAVLDPARHYFVSVLPLDVDSGSGHTMGGAPLPPGAGSVTVRVNAQPVPTAQVSVLVFEDMSPTNGAPDAKTVERGLGGFQILVEDSAGRYGQAGGQMLQDAYGGFLRNAKAGQPGCENAASAPDGVILTCDDGTALIQNLPPSKYGIQAVPPAGGPVWLQTSTIEGSKVIDAWVKANEPPYMVEFGQPLQHAFFGFVAPGKLAGLGGSGSVSGNVTNQRLPRPPDTTIYDSDSYAALGHTTAWVGLNSDGGGGPLVAAVQADGDGNFEIPNVPDGVYQLVVWDDYLDLIIGFRSVRVSGNTSVGNVPMWNWFARLEHNVFLDQNENGVRDEDEPGLPEQNVNLRFRDGTVYQSFPTDHTGFVPFDEVFPFFHWQVAEVDYARFKATGVTVTVDAGGPVDSGGVLRPQLQEDGTTSRTETGPVLLEGFQGFLGQTSTFDWGKKPYAPGENGGISGIVYYASTRGENNPRLGAGDPWEPGIPRVKVRLHKEVTREDGTTGLVFQQEVQTDSWDDALPSECVVSNTSDPLQYYDPATSRSGRCYDGVRNFNQVRPAVFDGGYAFMDILPGRYVVEVVPPPGYELVKEEDKNVDFGDSYGPPVVLALPNLALALALPDLAMVAEAQEPEPGLAQPPCAGEPHVVPDELTLFPGLAAPFAGAERPLCDRKNVVLSDQAQAAADFFLFTKTPIASHMSGIVADDLASEFNRFSPAWGEKWAPPYAPVSIHDWTGREIQRVYSDQWGRYDGPVPSTFTANIPIPSGYSANVLTTCINDPGPIPGPGGTLITDPAYDPRYRHVCYALQFMPGTTTYLDTPILPTAAFAAGDGPADCALPNQTPVIRSVNGTGTGPFLNPSQGDVLTITSVGEVEVPNSRYTGPTGTQPATIPRNFGFGGGGNSGNAIRLGNVALRVVSWNNGQIRASIRDQGGNLLVPVPSSGQLVITRGSSGRSTVAGITVTVSSETPRRVPDQHPTIQAAIDAANPGDLILVGPGTYNEMVVMAKQVRLQGAGAGSTFINAVKRPAEKLSQWRDRIAALFGSGTVDPLPGQTPIAAPGLEPLWLGSEEGAGVTVLAKNAAASPGSPNAFVSARQARIDGFTITGSDQGGGIFVNGWAHGLEISNNRLSGNGGFYSGGIRVGHPFLVQPDPSGPSYAYGYNTGLKLHNNDVTENGGLSGAGGGVSLYTGTDAYQLYDNWVCGNMTQGDGAGVAHFGLSDDGQIRRNTILLNQSFNQGLNRSGGGLLIAGEPAGNALSRGAGDVVVDANRIQSNQAGSGHGGGVRLERVNGLDVHRNPSNSTTWYRAQLTNNMIVNNLAGWAGAGVSLFDVARADIINNTIARNDSTATVGSAFTTNNPNVSAKQPSGIATQNHSATLAAAVPGANQDFSNPILVNNIVWQNRAFHYDGTGATPRLMPNLNPGAVEQCANGAYYWDLGKLDAGSGLTPRYSLLTNLTGPDGRNYNNNNNTTGNPQFAASYCNGARNTTLTPGFRGLQVAPATDEGGNWIDVRFGPLALTGDYHIGGSSAARNTALGSSAPAQDFDGQNRPQGTGYDRGADERP